MEKFTVYVLRDTDTIEYIVNDDIKGLRNALADGDLEPGIASKSFNTECEALAFCAGLGYGQDERALPSVYPLRSFEPYDIPYIDALTIADLI